MQSKRSVKKGCRRYVFLMIGTSLEEANISLKHCSIINEF